MMSVRAHWVKTRNLAVGHEDDEWLAVVHNLCRRAADGQLLSSWVSVAIGRVCVEVLGAAVLKTRAMVDG
jgi:hypothetical protein